MTDNLNEDFLKFLQVFRTGSSSFYYLDEFMLNNHELFKIEAGDIGSVSQVIHSDFQQACLEILSLSEDRLPDYLKEEREEKINTTLLRDVSKCLEKSTVLSAEASLSYKDVAKDMFDNVYVPLLSAAKLFHRKLK